MMAPWRLIEGVQDGTYSAKGLLQMQKVLLPTTLWHIIGQSFCLELGAMHKQLLSLMEFKQS